MKKERCGTAIVLVFVLFGGAVFGVEEPNDLPGISYAMMGSTESGISCGWFTVIDRDGMDGGHLIVELESCRVFSYELFTMQQGAQSGVLAELEADDIFIVWDEDQGHGGNQDFTYTNNAYVVENTPNDYIRVSRPAGDSVTNWVVYRATASGTLTITDTGLSEHEAIRLQRNIMQFDKYDDVDEEECVSPDDGENEITYTICWNNMDGAALGEAYIIDWLPSGVSYPDGEWTFGYDPNASPPLVLYPPDPGYDPVTHTYAWPLGSIDPNASGCVQLTVVVNEGAEPGRYLHNVAELWTTIYDPNGLQGTVVARAMVDTLVCCWDTNGILYVDKKAEGANSGVSWHDAYVDLQSALLPARTTECAEAYLIYVAEGTYSPGEDEDDTFDVPNGVYVYGGFKTGGCAFEERDPKRYETILTGRIDETTRNSTIVTMRHETLLDGVVVTEAGEYGIYGEDADFAIGNSVVKKSWDYGLRAVDGDVYVTWCNFHDNRSDGIRHEGDGFALYVENCWVRQNGRYGIQCLGSTPVVRNSIVSESDMAELGNEGILMVNPTYSPVLQNVTIAHNKAAGLTLMGSNLPDVQNCIVYHNNNGGTQLVGFSADDAAWYSCIQDCNEVNYNINTDPQFAYFDPNNVRIAYSSPCRDTGNPSLSYTEQLEMDRKNRVYGMAVDRGAYEVTCEDTSSPWDWNADGIVNLKEFARFAAVWRAHDPNDPAITDPNHPDHEYVTEPNSPGYVAPEAMALWYPDGYPFNFSVTGSSLYSIDVADLAAFVEDAPWLWMACWLTEGELLEMGFGEESQMGMMAFEAQPIEVESVESQMKALVNLIGPLESLWLADPDIQQEIDSTDWQEFMDALYDNLLEVYFSTQ